jgi:hypothetical protein
MRNTIFILSIISIAVILMAAYMPRATLLLKASLVVPDTTSFTDTDWHPILGDFINTNYGGFALVADPAIEYIHDEAHIFKADARTNFYFDQPNVIAWIGLRLNGTVVDSANIICANLGQPYPLSDWSLNILNPGDKLQLVERVSKNCTKVTTTYKTMVARAD